MNRLNRVAALLTAALVAPIATAQNSQQLSGTHIPDDAILAGFAYPAQMMTSPDWKLMPVEVIQAAGLQYLGVDPLDIEEIKVVAGMPSPAGPQAGAIIRFSKDQRIADLNPQLLENLTQKEFQGLPVYEMPEQPPIHLHQLDAQTIVASVGGYLKPIVDAAESGSGQLPVLAGKIPRRKGITWIAVFDQIRPMITGMLRQNTQQMPPQIQELANFAEYTDALLVNMDYGPMAGSFSVSALGRDEGSAAKLETALNNGINMGRDIAVGEVMRNLERQESSPVNDAMIRYVQRVSGDVINMVRPTRKGNVVRIQLSSQQLGGVGNMGVMVGLLLPAIQAARDAARRMSASNNMKQIGLAFHNYHSAYKRLPDRAIRDSNGKALLSWRVAILPFIEENALYEQFRLDEPWDSPHNMALVNQIPQVYVHPSARTAPGHTVFQVVQGEGLMFEETGQRRFRDVLDGLSNTIMAVETRGEHAVPWTKPADVNVDMADPMAQSRGAHQRGFHVLMGDGAVIPFTDSVEKEIFRRLLTRAGKETVDIHN